MASSAPPSLPTNLTDQSTGHITAHNSLDSWLATVPTSLASQVLSLRTVSASYTLVLADADNIALHVTASTGITVTLPSDASVGIAVGSSIPGWQYGAGQVTFAAGSGATLLARGSAFKSVGQYAPFSVTKVAANTWLLAGDITT